MKQFQLGVVIATRELSRTDGGTVLIEIGCPQSDTDLGWFVPYRITGIGDSRISRGASSVDAIYALQMTLMKIGIDLIGINKYNPGILTCELENWGFPVPRDIIDSMSG